MSTQGSNYGPYDEIRDKEGKVLDIEEEDWRV